MRFHTFPLLSGCNPSIRMSTGVHDSQQRRASMLLRWERALTLPVSIKNALFLLSQSLRRRWVGHSDSWSGCGNSGASLLSSFYNWAVLAQSIKHLEGSVWPPVRAAPCRRSRWKSRPPRCCRWSPAPPAGRWAAPSAPVIPPGRGQNMPMKANRDKDRKKQTLALGAPGHKQIRYRKLHYFPSNKTRRMTLL